MDDLVSIITPTHNSAHFLKEAINSVIEQTYWNWELWVIDDNSSDSTPDLMSEFIKNDKRINYLRIKKHIGSARTRNLGIRFANGRFIAFLDSDDMWLSHKLEKQIQFIYDKKAILSYTAYKKINEEGKIISNAISIPEMVTYQDLLYSCVIGCLTAIYDRKRLGKIYMPDIKRGQDYALWLKILKKGYVAYGLNEALALYRVRRASLSSNKLVKAKYQWKIYRKLEKLSFIKSFYYLLHYSYYGIKKYWM